MTLDSGPTSSLEEGKENQVKLPEVQIPQLKDLVQDTNIVNNQRAEDTKKKRRKGRGVGES